MKDIIINNVHSIHPSLKHECKNSLYQLHFVPSYPKHSEKHPVGQLSGVIHQGLPPTNNHLAARPPSSIFNPFFSWRLMYHCPLLSQF